MIITEIKDNIVTVKTTKPGENNFILYEVVSFENGSQGIIINAGLDFSNIAIYNNGDKPLTLRTRIRFEKKPFTIDIENNFMGTIRDINGNLYQINKKDLAHNIRPIYELRSQSLLNVEIDYQMSTIDSRKPVNQPLETGLISIDGLLPIGKGQREAIIGNKTTGKTSIAIDTIINQKGKDVICIFAAINIKQSVLLNIYKELKDVGALDYTMIFSCLSSENPINAFLLPYVATTIAEAYRNEGKDVLIIYDDLTRHAKAYRTISLLIGMTPGRDAYPGDIFYIHSRLLERSGNFNEMYGSGSITSLPIMEINEDDISDYITTNVISITDGQIILSSELFNYGVRPAIDIGKSVSRVGSSAQKGHLKTEASGLKNTFTQYKVLKNLSTQKDSLPPEKKKIFEVGSKLEQLLIQKRMGSMKYDYEWLYLLLLNRDAFKPFEPRDLSVVKRYLSKFLDDPNSIQSKIVELVGFNEGYGFKNVGISAKESAEVVRFFVEQIFCSFLKWVARKIYRIGTENHTNAMLFFRLYPNQSFELNLKADQEYDVDDYRGEISDLMISMDSSRQLDMAIEEVRKTKEIKISGDRKTKTKLGNAFVEEDIIIHKDDRIAEQGLGYYEEEYNDSNPQEQDIQQFSNKKEVSKISIEEESEDEEKELDMIFNNVGNYGKNDDVIDAKDLDEEESQNNDSYSTENIKSFLGRNKKSKTIKNVNPEIINPDDNEDFFKKDKDNKEEIIKIDENNKDNGIPIKTKKDDIDKEKDKNMKIKDKIISKLRSKLIEEEINRQEVEMNNNKNKNYGAHIPQQPQQQTQQIPIMQPQQPQYQTQQIPIMQPQQPQYQNQTQQIPIMQPQPGYYGQQPQQPQYQNQTQQIPIIQHPPQPQPGYYGQQPQYQTQQIPIMQPQPQPGQQGYSQPNTFFFYDPNRK